MTNDLSQTDRISDGCPLCEPAPHANCETHTSIVIEDPLTADRAIIPVCLGHFEAIEEATNE